MNDDIFKLFEDFPDCVTVPQLQTMLHIGKNTAYKLLETGEINHRRLGRKYLIPKICVIDYLLKSNS